jgi:hypothetical protein
MSFLYSYNVEPPLRNNYADTEGQQFELNELSFDQAKLNFRFEKNDIPILAELLGLPKQIRTGTKNNVNRTIVFLPYKRWDSHYLEICCLSSDPDEKYKFSTLGVVTASRPLE